MIGSFRGLTSASSMLFALVFFVSNFFWTWPVFAGSLAETVTSLPYGVPTASSLSDYDPFESRVAGNGSCIPPSIGDELSGKKSNLPALAAYLSPYLYLSELYTDNIYLAPAGFEKSDFVTTVNPGIRGCTIGSLLRANFNTSIEGVAYLHNPPSNVFYLQQNARFNYKVLPGHFFIDGHADYGQTVINPLQPNTANQAYYTPNNITNYFARTLSPYWEQSFGPLGIGTLRYTYGRVNYGASSIRNSTNEGKSFVLKSPSYNSSWSWIFNWSSNRVFYEGVSEQLYYDTVSTRLGYRLNKTIKLLGTIGIEDNYLPDGRTERYGSKFWSAGFVWTGPFYYVSFLWGHRFFGTSFNANLLFRRANMQLGIQYNETPTSEPLSVLNSRRTTLSLPSNVTTLPLNESQYTENYLAKRWQANYTYIFSRNHLTLSGYDERDRYFTIPMISYHLVGESVSWGWSLTSRTNMIATLEDNLIFKNGIQVFHQNIGTLSWNHALSASSLFGASLSHLRGEPINKFDNYTADAIELYFHTIF